MQKKLVYCKILKLGSYYKPAANSGLVLWRVKGSGFAERKN